MFCEKCNIEFQEGLRFCKWCGNTLTERRRVTSELHGCPSCASPIQSNWVFCKACGVKLNAPASGQAGEFCPRCGSKSDPDWLNCARCGEDLGRVKAPKHTAIASAPGREALTHCSECGDKLEPGATYCKGCGAAVFAPSAAFGASSLLCRSCKSYSPLGSGECRVCGAKFGDSGETVDISAVKKSSTLPDLDEHLPSPDFQSSETVAINLAGDEQVISGAHTLIIGPSGAIEPPPLAEEIFQEEAPTGTAAFGGERPAGGAETTVLPGVAGSKTEQPSQTGLISETRTTGPVEEEPGEDAVEQEQVEAAEVKKKRGGLSTQIEVPAINLDELDASIQTSEGPRAKTAEPAANSTIVMGSISSIKEEAEKPQLDETEARYREPLTAPFGLEAPEDEPATRPEIPAPQVQGETAAGGSTAQHQAATTAEFGAREQSWAPATPRTQAIGQPVVTQQTDSERLDYPRVPSTLPPKTQKKGTMVASLIVAVLVIGVTAFVVYWLFSGGSPSEPETPQAPTSPATTPPEAPPATPPKPATPVPPEGMVYVPGGQYTIGRDGGDAIAGPAHTVTLKPYFIDRTEVTNAEYKKFIDATGNKPPSDWENGSYPDGRDNWPVTNVSWQEANAYADWIGKRLPTEAEWESAARGTDGRLYPWGNEWRPNYANIETQAITEVGQYKEGASPVGALDMIGNVWELTADQFELYPGSSAKFPRTKKPGITYYVIRGGAYDGNQDNDTTRRGFLEKDRGYSKTGFRLVKDIN
ncbi:MAG TPA: SUMF1/EgtB/PvdO family nonheme iron enzyme [Blastocatellia bacterium]|nr:SUMF1/EgtB/PvdO family nonheme iron enzyme [Blastocatellia bacterium]